MEVEINESEKESDALLSKRVKTLRSLPSPMSNPLNSEMKKKGMAEPPGHAGSVATQVTQDPTVETTNVSKRDKGRKKMMTVVERDEGGSQKEDEWSRSDNNQRREELDHDSRDRKVGRDCGNKYRYQEGREHHNGNDNGSKEQREKKNPMREEHGTLRGYGYSAVESVRMNNPTERFASQGQRNILQATGTSLSIFFRLDQNAGWCPKFEKQNLRFQDKEMCL
ncbi:hypothetical protein DAPPUDRAFT_102363 [Daphnia pulex]|uniref:Uncharacterized protein n=1 Tax=Daphnia pulex TaxID=6669 RepID=E9GG85_DAPPU|nr:hypothetical protein DAPPUDRAFT_102363 [Daphnia pulex]|eukprot:EFX81355.1 hypothetical protein DAPPUDRAFT_102363 [Daphnia pulex]